MNWQAIKYEILNQLFGWSRFWKLRGQGLNVKQANILIYRAKLSRKKKLAILARDNYRCHLCGHPGWWENMEIDHVKALANEGDNSDRNLKAAHRSCNRRKGVK